MDLEVTSLWSLRGEFIESLLQNKRKEVSPPKGISKPKEYRKKRLSVSSLFY